MMFDIKKKCFLKLPQSLPCGNTQTSCSEYMAWDKGGVIHPAALSSGCTVHLPFCSQTGIFLTCNYPSHTDKQVFLSKKLRSKLKVLRGEAVGFSGWAAKSGFFSYSLYWLCASSVSLSALCICFSYCCPIAPSLAYKILVFLCVLSATGYTEPSKNNVCEALTYKGVFAKRA